MLAPQGKKYSHLIKAWLYTKTDVIATIATSVLLLDS